jgi:serine/threonine-protein kinase
METVDRRLVPRLVETLGTTPIRHLALPQGSWLVGLRHGGREWTVPVDIGRREHWDNVPPGGGAPVPIVLPDTLAEDECWVPAGWFRSGGDREAAHEEAQVARRVWVDAFVMEKYAVTNARFLAFLDDLVANGREAEALTYVPRERAARPGELGQMIYGRLPNGRFYLRPDADGDPWLPDQPVISVLWSAARAFAAWEAARTGLPWRLPVALEWEKAARGVDGRFFPWGDFLDPSWCCMRDSHAKRPSLATVTAFPEDVSPYGVRGLGGNVSDLCLDGVTPGGPAVLDDRAVVPDPAGPPPAQPYTKGGSWFFGARYARSANLLRRYADVRSSDTGFRLVRSEAVGCRR